MNRTDRLLAIVLELQARRTRRAEDLAATFEVSKRTIYRDVQALCKAGVPVVAAPGQGYSLVEGYFLPPLRFTADEAMTLILGSDVMAQNFDAEYRAAAQSAVRKITNVLTDTLRDEIESLQRGIKFVAVTPSLPESGERLQMLRRAIIRQQRVRFVYTARSGDNGAGAIEREADPYGLIHVGAAWYLIGYCHLRQDVRNFRLDRIDKLMLLDITFVRPSDFVMGHERGEDRSLIARVLFAPSVARWVREAPSFYTIDEEERLDGLLMTLAIRHEREVVQWLLGWGAQVRVLEPESLRRLLADEAAAILGLYAGTVEGEGVKG
jgi:predicted DNA-binding transcriptional regulator YafY